VDRDRSRGRLDFGDDYKDRKDSFISQVVRLVRQRPTEQVAYAGSGQPGALWLTFIAVGSGAATMAAWLNIRGSELRVRTRADRHGLVITCPHALGLAIPLVVAVSTALSARRGLSRTEPTAFEKARNIEAVISTRPGR